MKYRLQRIIILGLGIAFLLAGLLFLSTLTPGGIALGLCLLGLYALLYVLWCVLRTVEQIRELLMLGVAKQHKQESVHDG